MAVDIVDASSEFYNSSDINRPKNVISLPSSSLTKIDCQFAEQDENLEHLPSGARVPFNAVDNDSLQTRTNFIDQIFEKCDDVHADYLKKGDNAFEKVAYQQKYLAFTPPAQTPEKYETEEAKTERLLATVEGRKDFCEILEHAGINSGAYLAGVFSNQKKKVHPNFGCSTPITSLTPHSNKIKTPLPLSGIRHLISPLGDSNCSKKDRSSFMTPLSSSNLLPELDRCCTTDNMKTILLGITCFVDVRTEKENRSEICKSELLAIGAKVEKNFTKKVTHVIFKEGRMSTFLKAKKLGIPIVSVVWIEACKIAKGPVDPALYPPTRLEKYLEESPFSVVMHRRIKRLMKSGIKAKDLKGSSLRISPTVYNSNKRKAVTDVKENRPAEKSLSKDRQCTKKLNFIDFDKPKALGDKDDIMKLDSTLNDTDNLSDSSIFAKFKLNSIPNRKTAKRALEKKRKVKLKNLNHFFKEDNWLKENVELNFLEKNLKLSENLLHPKMIDNDKNMPLSSTCIPSGSNDERASHFIPTTESKRKKLFDPNELHISNDIQPLTVPISFPYADSPLTKKTRSDKAERKFCNDVTAVAQLDVTESNVSVQHRSSLSLFMSKKENSCKNSSATCKSTPTIVFTSIHRDNYDKLTVIVNKLGIFELEDQVSERTTHVVTNCLRRTLNLLKGLARGCWILRDDWIYQSELSSKWLAEEHFELKSYSPAITDCRLQKQIFKKSFSIDLFSSFGAIYVSSNTKPPTKELITLIKLCHGKIASCARGAKLIVGNKAVTDRKIVKVHEKWILDSIFYNKPFDIDEYIIKPANN